MHVLAPRSIASMRDLDGKTVVVDLPDSSTFVTAINVFDRLGIRPHLIYMEPRLAVDMLRNGEVDAIVAIEGKPLTWLKQITDRNLHLVPVEYARTLQEEYLPSKLSAADYPNLVPLGGKVDTIAAEAVLAAYNWAPKPTATAGCSFWSINSSPRSSDCSSRRFTRNGRSSRCGRRSPAGHASAPHRNGSTAICHRRLGDRPPRALVEDRRGHLPRPRRPLRRMHYRGPGGAPAAPRPVTPRPAAGSHRGRKKRYG